MFIKPQRRYDAADQLLGPAISGSPLPPAAPARPKGLFGGGASEESAAKMRMLIEQLMQAQQQAPAQQGQMQQPQGLPAQGAFPEPRQLGMRDRVHDFFATYNGEPTRRDQYEAENNAARFGDAFGGLVGNPDLKGRDSRVADMQRLIAGRAARGGDVTAFKGLAEDYRNDGRGAAMANRLPPPLQAAGRAAPSLGAAYQFGQAENDVYSVDGSLVRGAKGTGEFDPVYTAPPRAPWDWKLNDDGSAAPRSGGPADPDYKYSETYQTTRGQTDATPAKPVDPLNQGEMVGQVLSRVQQVGVEGLTPGERAIWDVYQREPANPYAFMGGGMGAPAPGPAVNTYSGQPGGGQAPAQQQGDPYPGIADGATVTQGGRRYRRQGNQMVPL